MIVWRPLMAGKVTATEVKTGVVDLDDLLKYNALLDAEAATHQRETKKSQRPQGAKP